MKKWLFLFLTTSMFACDDPYYQHPFHMQLSKDDCSYLCTDIDSFGYILDHPQYYYDTVYYLVNSKDTAAERIETGIHSKMITFAIELFDNYLEGYSVVNFQNVDFMYYAQVRVGLWNTSDVSTKKIEFCRKVRPTDVERRAWDYSVDLEDLDSSYIDTAQVLTRTYENVYKIHYKASPIYGIRTVYYVKRYGFLLIELNDSGKIELIGYKNLK
jgi:hypothetical protein